MKRSKFIPLSLGFILEEFPGIECLYLWDKLRSEPWNLGWQVRHKQSLKLALCICKMQCLAERIGSA